MAHTRVLSWGRFRPDLHPRSRTDGRDCLFAPSQSCENHPALLACLYFVDSELLEPESFDFRESPLVLFRIDAKKMWKNRKDREHSDLKDIGTG